MGKKRVAQLEQAEKNQGKDSPDKKDLVKGAGANRALERARFYINATYNNIMINVTNNKGDILAWATSGSAGFKGPRKATPYAASRTAELVLEKLGKVELREVEIFVNGIGAGRDAAIRALTGKGLNVVALKDITPVPHNGCRPPKVRRV